MDEILERYNQGKFQKCLELIKLMPDADNAVDNFILQNCSLMCNAIICILDKDQVKKKEIEEQFYLFLENVTSVGILSTSIPLQLKLTVIFNFYWWLLFHGDKNLDEEKSEEYLKFVNSGLSRVLGQSKSEAVYLSTPEKIFENLCSLQRFLSKENSKTMFLVVEIVVVVLMYILILRKDCLKQCANITSMLIINLREKIVSVECVDEFYEEEYIPHIFKFGLNKMSSVLTDLHSSSIDYLEILHSTLLLLFENYRESLKTLQKNSNSSFLALKNYLAAFNSHKLGRKNLCLGIVMKNIFLNMQLNLKMRFLILYGRLCCAKGDHKEALMHFENASNISIDNPLPLFYIGHQWGQMGLYDKMVEYFEKLLQIIENQQPKYELKSSFVNVILDWIHPIDEIMENEALYALAISYGLNERFFEAAETFERLFQYPITSGSGAVRERIIQIPNRLTVLHDASITNLLAGNLTKAEEIALQAINLYFPQEFPADFKANKSLLDKDVNWLQKTIEEELLESDLSAKELKNTIAYSEGVIYFLPENVIALLIMSEVQKIQGVEEYKTTLKKIFSCFSGYLAKIIKKQNLSECEKTISFLIKALASKICLWIANIQFQNENILNTESLLSIEKMFKRSLSCNKGDKDVLHNYCKFLLETGKRREASKLWYSFCKEEPTVTLDSVQSLSLRYFLTSKITNGELEKIQKELELIDH